MVVQCDAPDGYVADGTVCSDADATTFPDAPEACDGVDHDGATVDDDTPTYVDVAGTYTGGMAMGAPPDPKPGYRMVAGVVEMPAGPWFMKCTGPAATMEATAPGLKSICRIPARS